MFSKLNLKLAFIESVLLFSMIFCFSLIIDTWIGFIYHSLDITNGRYLFFLIIIDLMIFIYPIYLKVKLTSIFGINNSKFRNVWWHFGNPITIKGYDQQHAEITRWLTANCANLHGEARNYFEYGEFTRIYIFLRKDDATRFKLTWQ